MAPLRRRRLQDHRRLSGRTLCNLLARLGLRRRRDDPERGVDDELGYHLERRAEELIARGASPGEARRRAAEEFGDVRQARAYCARMAARVERRRRRRRAAGDLALDVHYAARTLARTPAFTALIVVIMAVGIGANTAVFSVINAVLLQPLDYPQADRLLQVWESDARQGSFEDPISPLDLEDWQEQSTTLAEIAGFGYEALALTGDGPAERIVGIETSDNFFATLGVEPALGRTFAIGEEGPGNRVVVLGNSLWRSRFAADPEVLGRSITLGGLPCVVIGVMPEGFAFPSAAELWTPFTFDVGQMSRGSHFLFGIARLAPGATLMDARAETAAIAARLEAAYPGTNANHSIALVPLHEQLVGDVELTLWVVFGAVGLVLLVACGNVANLLLVRGAARAGEMSIRKALGAGRWRLVRQLLIESTMLSLLSGAIGLMLTAWGVEALVRAAPGNVLRGARVGIDASMLLFALGVSLLAAAAFGAGPTLQLAGDRGHGGLLGAGSGRTTSGRGLRRLRDGLVAVEVAMTLVLLFAAGLLIGNLAELRDVEPGFRSAGVLTARIALPPEQYRDPASRRQFMDRLTAEVAALPGIVSFGTVDSLPFSFSRSATSFAIEGDVESPEAPRHADIREVTPGYFRTMAIPLLRGREITADDGAGAPGVAVVNEAYARRFFPGGDALGRRIQIGSGEEVAAYGEPIWREIVGVVGNIIHDDLTAAAAPEMYVPYEQHPSTRVALALRTRGEPADAIEPVRQAVLRVDPGQPVYDTLPMEARLERFLAVPRANAWLLGVFSAVALSLAIIGVASVVSYAVAQRTPELGIRVALGASAASVVRLVLRQGMAPVAAGLPLGLAAAPLAGRLMEALLFRTDPTRPSTLLLPAALLTAASLLACLLPARRALGVDPIQTLRAG